MTPSRTPILLFLAILLICGCSSGGGELSYEQAAELVLEEVVKPNQLDEKAPPLILFGWPEPLGEGDVIHPYEKPGYEPFAQHTTIESVSWFFWVDDFAGAHYAHENRFVLVDRATGDITTMKQMWWPVLNDQGLWVERADYWDRENWVFSNIPIEEQSSFPRTGNKPRLSLMAPPPLQASSGDAAMVINGWWPEETCQEDFEKDADGMHDSLTAAGFDVTYFGPDEDLGGSKPDHPATIYQVDAFLREKAKEMQPCQTLYIYAAGHGTVTSRGMAYLGPLFEKTLTDRLKEFSPGVHIITVLQGCYSGGFIDSLREVSDVTISSTGAHDPSWGDLDYFFWVSDPNTDDEGSEYTSGYREDFDEIRADPAQMEIARQRAEAHGTDIFEEIAIMSHLSALEKDVTYLNGWSFPNAVRGDPNATKPKPTPVSTSLSDPSGDCMLPSGVTVTGECPVDILNLSVSFDESTGMIQLGTQITEMIDLSVMDFCFWADIDGDPETGMYMGIEHVYCTEKELSNLVLEIFDSSGNYQGEEQVLETEAKTMIDETGTWFYLSLPRDSVTTTEGIKPGFMSQVWYHIEGNQMLDITDPIRTPW